MSIEFKPYAPAHWAVDQIIRFEKEKIKIQDICEHGLPHPNKDWRKDQKKSENHKNCDGCCKL